MVDAVRSIERAFAVLFEPAVRVETLRDADGLVLARVWVGAREHPNWAAVDGTRVLAFLHRASPPYYCDVARQFDGDPAREVAVEPPLLERVEAEFRAYHEAQREADLAADRATGRYGASALARVRRR
jgi:hypothetical protein